VPNATCPNSYRYETESKNILAQNSSYFFTFCKNTIPTKGLLITPFKDLEVSDANVISRLQVRAAAVLLKTDVVSEEV